MKPPELIHTACLILRKPTSGDAEAIFSHYAQDPEVTRFLLWRPHASLHDTHMFLSACLKNWEGESDFTWAIERPGESGVIGMIGAQIDQHGANLGYVLMRPEWNKGYITEAVKALSDVLLTLDSVYRVWAVCDVENTASARVLEKSGMTCEGILRRWLILPNAGSVPRDCYCFSRTK
jgi:[ribosomal protein S5]-alanine N-acetyltransferase